MTELKGHIKVSETGYTYDIGKGKYSEYFAKDTIENVIDRMFSRMANDRILIGEKLYINSILDLRKKIIAGTIPYEGDIILKEDTKEALEKIKYNLIYEKNNDKIKISINYVESSKDSTNVPAIEMYHEMLGEIIVRYMKYDIQFHIDHIIDILMKNNADRLELDITSELLKNVYIIEYNTNEKNGEITLKIGDEKHIGTALGGNIAEENEKNNR